MKPNFNFYTSKEFRKICTAVYQIEDLSKSSPYFYPLFKKKFLGREKYFNAPFMFQSYPSEHNGWVTLMNELKKYSFADIEVKSDLDLPSIDPLLKKYSSSVRSDIKLPTDFESYFKSLSQKMRSNVSRANRDFLKNNFTLKTCNSESDLRQFYSIIFNNYKYVEKVPAQPFSLFKELLKINQNEKTVELYGAFDGDKMICGAIIIYHDNTTEYAWGGTLTDYKKLQPSYYLLSKAIEMAISEKKSYFSFGCSDITDNALLDHKKRWGCTQTPLFTYSNKSNLNSKLQRGKSILNTLYSIAPNWLVKPLLIWIYRIFV